MSLYSRYPCINHGRQHPTFLPAPVSFYEVYDIGLSVVTPDLTFFGRRSRTDSRGIFQPVRRDAVAILLEGKEKEKKRRKKRGRWVWDCLSTPMSLSRVKDARRINLLSDPLT